ncbi:MAG: alanine--tRNA ligase [Bacilli bacterium]|nr:alanine--tRNA ligase [Bacilli bacterium]
MKTLKSSEIRKIWISFFESKKHFFEKGVSLIPNNDPTLLWINSGVAGLKKYFDGREVPKHRRIVNIQKSIRTNDIENVGKTSRHHTFFEMLGNFSIGDYFKKEAIEFAFELLTSKKFFSIPKNKLYITYYLHDIETANIWISLGIDKNHVIPNKDNFWEIGEGPCGPNAEIFFDRGEKYDPFNKGVVLLKDNLENERFIEIWNIVFSQFNSKKGVKRENYNELPSKNIDTGAGLERFACIFQQKETNFETDLFMPIIQKIEFLAKVNYLVNKIAFRIISDHAKACVFALFDGAIFSNEKNGYVLRRLLRRAVYYGHEIGINKPFIYNLVDIISDIYQDFYPELKLKKELIKKNIRQEEENFFKTLENGKKIFQDMVNSNNINAFKLYDTYGFPIDLTIELAKKHNIKINLQDFETKMQKQRNMARQNIKKNVIAHDQSKDLLNFVLKSNFVYEPNLISGKVLGLFKDGKEVKEIIDSGEIIFDKTNFYAESGGQISDNGKIENDKTKCIVENVIKAPNGQHLHFVKVLDGKILKGDSFLLKINTIRRNLISYNHTAVHLLQAALNNCLLNNIEQKGSYVSDKYLHFDFNCHQKVDLSALRKIERFVNEKIFENINVDTLELPIEKAKTLGAKMFFAEKYGKIVRVVKIGNFSLEFCGGTHAKNTRDLGLFKIISEESVASGIRRITAVTSKNAYDTVCEESKILEEISVKVNISKNNIKKYIDNLISINSDLKTNLKQNNNILAKNISFMLQKEIQNIKGYNILVSEIEINNRDIMVLISNFLIEKMKNYLVVLTEKVGEAGDGNFLFITTDIKNIDVRCLINEICGVFGGKGGGKSFEVQGQTKQRCDINQINDIIQFFLFKQKNGTRN